jgi:hypothetical protein
MVEGGVPVAGEPRCLWNVGGTLGPPRRYCRKLEAQPVQVFGVALRLLQQLHRQIEIDLGPEQSLDLVPRCGANLA